MFKVLTDGCKPTRGTKYSACIDLYASEDVTIGAGETAIVGLGIAIDKDYIEAKYYSQCIGMPPATKHLYQSEIHKQINVFMSTHYILLEPRSSLRAKGLIVGSGIIDMDFAQELKLIVNNPVRTKQYVQNGQNYTVLLDDDDNEFTIKKGDRIAQATLLEHKSHLFGIESEDTRDGGIGSTDKEFLALK